MAHEHLLDAWLDAQADRVIARQRAQVDTAKLVSTFLAGVAAAMCGVALQVERTADATLDTITCVGFGIALLLTLVIFAADRVREPDHVEVESRAVRKKWDAVRQLDELREATDFVLVRNQDVVRCVRVLIWVQAPIAVGTSVLAALSVLGG